jgi:hypothetical protein
VGTSSFCGIYGQPCRMTEGNAMCLWEAAGKDKEHMYGDTASLFSDGFDGKRGKMKSDAQ